MALSMEEQRILAEIERQLADEDPSLAVRLSTFRRPGLTAGLRTPRGRMLVSLFVVAAVALLSLMVYSLMPLRVLPGRGGGGSTVAPIQTGLGTQASQVVSGARSAGKGHAHAAKRHERQRHEHEGSSGNHEPAGADTERRPGRLRAAARSASSEVARPAR